MLSNKVFMIKCSESTSYVLAIDTAGEGTTWAARKARVVPNLSMRQAATRRLDARKSAARIVGDLRRHQVLTSIRGVANVASERTAHWPVSREFTRARCKGLDLKGG